MGPGLGRYIQHMYHEVGMDPRILPGVRGIPNTRIQTTLSLSMSRREAPRISHQPTFARTVNPIMCVLLGTAFYIDTARSRPSLCRKNRCQQWRRSGS